ncbi:hypothethical protein (plasmid) [Ralstonia solanacearum CMR15]|nr:hypothethical protein [Ralstonia solanacearum CMR15]
MPPQQAATDGIEPGPIRHQGAPGNASATTRPLPTSLPATRPSGLKTARPHPAGAQLSRSPSL